MSRGSVADHPGPHGGEHLAAIGGVEQLALALAVTAAAAVMLVFVKLAGLLLRFTFTILRGGHHLGSVFGLLGPLHRLAGLFQHRQDLRRQGDDAAGRLATLRAGAGFVVVGHRRQLLEDAVFLTFVLI